MADIAIRGLRKSYGRSEIVHGIDLDIADGEFVVMLGPSGCGKSTLLRLIAGLEADHRRRDRDRRPGRQQAGAARARLRHGVPELRPLPAHDRRRQHRLRAEGRGRGEGRARRARSRASPRRWASHDFLDRKPAALSGGQRQRVAMGRAMIREPSVFLFDEPLSNLDAKLRVQMRVEIKRLHQRLGATSIFVTHDQVEAMTLADRLVVMNEGRIEQVGAPAEVYRRPASRFVAGFIGSPAMNFFPARLVSSDVVALDERSPAAAGERQRLASGGIGRRRRLPARGYATGRRRGRRHAALRDRDGRGARRQPAPVWPARRGGMRRRHSLGRRAGDARHRCSCGSRPTASTCSTADRQPHRTGARGACGGVIGLRPGRRAPVARPRAAAPCAPPTGCARSSVSRNVHLRRRRAGRSAGRRGRAGDCR